VRFALAALLALPVAGLLAQDKTPAPSDPIIELPAGRRLARFEYRGGNAHFHCYLP